MIEPTFDQILLEGLQLMLIGMSIVFCFLILLVGVLNLTSAAVLRWAPEDAPSEDSHAFPRAGGVDQRRLAAVIGAAVAQYRKRH